MDSPSPDEVPYGCNSCRSGHDVHYIQALRSGNDRETLPAAGTLVEVLDDGEFVVEDLHGEVHHLWNHSPERLRRLAHEAGNSILLHLRWQLVRIPSSNGSYCVCVCPPEERTPCGRQTLPGTKQHTQFVRPPVGIQHLPLWEQDQAEAEVVESLLEGILDQLWKPEADGT